MLPIGLAHGVKLTRAVAKDQPVTEADIEPLKDNEALRLRREHTSYAAG